MVTNGNIDDFQKHVNDWLFFQCILPFLLICCGWVIGAIMGAKYCFQKTFSEGGLLVFSAMLLFGSYIELQEIQNKKLIFGIKLNTIKNITILFAILLLVFYGAIKTDIFSHDYYNQNSIPPKLFYYSISNILIAIISIIWSYFAVFNKIENLFRRN